MANKVDITIYGPGCPRCRDLIRFVQTVAAEENIPIQITQDADFEKYIDKGILRTPTLEIRGEIKASGTLPSRQKLKDWLQASPNSGANCPE